jgi:hypothetical protein
MSTDDTGNKHWSSFAKIALSILSVLSTFILMPPNLSIDEQSTMLWLIRFLIAVLITFLYIPQKRFIGTKNYRLWVKLAVAGLMFGLLSLGIYNIMRFRWSINFYGERLVIGKNIKKEAKETQERLSKELGRLIEEKDLVKFYTGRTEKIWPINTIEGRYYILCLFYTLAILGLSFFFIAILQSISTYDRDQH